MSATTALPDPAHRTAQPRRPRIGPASVITVSALLSLGAPAVTPYSQVDVGSFSGIPAEGLGGVAQPLADQPARARIEQLKELSGLTWAQLAKAFGVTRRSLLHWQSGGSISAANDERLTELLAQLHRAGVMTSEEGRAWLMAVDEDGYSRWLDWTEGRRVDPRGSWMSRQPEPLRDP